MRLLPAVIKFNDGNCDIYVKSFQNACMETGYFIKILYLKKDESRISRMSKKANEETKTQQKRLKTIRKIYIDKDKEGYFL